MDLKHLMQLRERIYDNIGGEVEVLIGGPNGKTSALNGVHFNEYKQNIIIH